MNSDEDMVWLYRKLERMKSKGYPQELIRTEAVALMAMRGTFEASPWQRFRARLRTWVKFARARFYQKVWLSRRALRRLRS